MASENIHYNKTKNIVYNKDNQGNVPFRLFVGRSNNLDFRMFPSLERSGRYNAGSRNLPKKLGVPSYAETLQLERRRALNDSDRGLFDQIIQTLSNCTDIGLLLARLKKTCDLHTSNSPSGASTPIYQNGRNSSVELPKY